MKKLEIELGVTALFVIFGVLAYKRQQRDLKPAAE
ncbi:hypothetical protein JOC74_002580 [Bacillus capparidis]|uniref:Uncharacterized protein n=1 Tax=Bacillus capparidis TaxID=1840411 RepID=A0ABS4CX24_9BACI|nr:hypothetical protein [Bacillus capparidis]